MGLNGTFMAILKDGTLRVAGNNYYNQLGVSNIGTSTSFNTFQTPDISGVKKIASGEYHTLFLMADGTVMASGRNTSNELLPKVGEEGKIIKQVDISGVADVFAGEKCSFFLMNDGTLKAVGSNNSGKLGIGNVANPTNLVTVPLVGVAEVICGEEHTVFLMKDGKIKTAGVNNMGQLGIGSTTQTYDVQNIALNLTVTKVACGRSHTVMRMSDGTIRGFGYNGFGQLGDGTLTSVLAPKDLGKTFVKSVHCGAGFTYLFMDNGVVLSSGDNQRGQLGIGTVTNANTFQSVNVTNVKDIVCNGLSVFFLLRDGTVKACGTSSYGEFGMGQNTTSVATITQLSLNNVDTLIGGYAKLTRYLIQDNNTFKALQDGTWKVLGESILTQSIIAQGMISLANLTNVALSQLTATAPELLAWYEEDPGAKTLTMNGPIWEEVSTTLPSPEDMVLKGMPDLKVVPPEAWADLGGDFEVVTYTNDLDETQKLFLDALPKSQLIAGSTDFSEIAQMLLVASTGVKVVASSDAGVTWKALNNGVWQAVNFTTEAVKASGMSVATFNLITADQWKALGSAVRFAYLLEGDALLDKITVTKVQITDATPSLDSMQVEYEELTLEGRLKDLERLNAINLAKLNFKANALLLSDSYKLDDMVVDTFEKDSIQTTQSNLDETVEQVFTASSAMGDGFYSEVIINQTKSVKDFGIK